MCIKAFVRMSLVLLLALTVAAIYGCKKDSGVTGPGSGGGGLYGSGTISSSSPTQGNLSFTGQGVWPAGAGPSVLAVYDTVKNRFSIVGYRQISGSYYSAIILQIDTVGGVRAGTYAIAGGTWIHLAASFDTTRSVDSVVFKSVSGSIVVSSAGGTSASGTFSINANRLQPPANAEFTGSFDVSYVRGRLPLQGGPGIDSSIYHVYGGPIYIGDTAGYHPERHGYSWLGFGTATATYYGSYPYYIIVTYGWNSVRVDAVQGSNGQYFSTGTTGNTLDHQNIAGPPDGAYALVGGWYPGSGGYVLIGASGSSLSSIKVFVIPK